LLYTTGIRASELCNIRYSDINFRDRVIRVLGKGRKERFVIFDNETGELLERYIVKTTEEKGRSCYLFHNTETGKPISPFQVAKIVKTHSQKKNLNITPHLIRHCFAFTWSFITADNRYLYSDGKPFARNKYTIFKNPVNTLYHAVR